MALLSSSWAEYIKHTAKAVGPLGLADSGWAPVFMLQLLVSQPLIEHAACSSVFFNYTRQSAPSLATVNL